MYTIIRASQTLISIDSHKGITSHPITPLTRTKDTQIMDRDGQGMATSTLRVTLILRRIALSMNRGIISPNRNVDMRNPRPSNRDSPTPTPTP